MSDFREAMQAADKAIASKPNLDWRAIAAARLGFKVETAQDLDRALLDLVNSYRQACSENKKIKKIMSHYAAIAAEVHVN